ncbi:RecQ family ATP-dependent DNA helicase [Hoylesella timonensis]|jgi:hypothetical protein|uniref:DNA 3'-5' helicase n=3 Tax=Hoylesella timonensis TaxID=386414 RepID=A0A098YRC2_9BACT|nr:RecQ family ATP-dependent DNA helicase [Hoylesella timonensis]KGI21899.1 hypothetical protein HMPREF9304_07575 [Hoylesella timonensis S9-PR14]
MMKQNLHIQSELILNHIELTDEDLSELPPYPKVEETKVQPRFVGIVCRCRSLDNYAFVVTNMCGINSTSTPYSPVQLYLEKSQWKDVTYLKEDMWITFELKKQPNRDRHAAINAKCLSSTSDDYNICRNYLGRYDKIYGTVNGKRFSESILSVVVESFFKKSEGRQLVLSDLYQRKSLDPREWELLLSNMTTEERDSFTFNTDVIEPTAVLRVTLYKYLNSIEWIKNSCIIDALMSSIGSHHIIELLMESFKSEADKHEWIDYVINSGKTSDKLFAELYLMTNSIDIFNRIADKSCVSSLISKDKDKIKDYLLFCVSIMGKTELDSVVDTFDVDVLIDALKLMSDDERLKFVCSLSDEKASKLASDKRFEDFDLTNRLMSIEEGRRILLNDLYVRKCNDYKEWDNYLSHLSESELQSFVLDTKCIKPTAELRFCLFKYTKLLDWLKHPSVISMIGKQNTESEITLKQIIDNFDNEEDKKEWVIYAKDSSISSENLIIELFYLTGSVDAYHAIENKSIILEHMNEAGVLEVKKFLKFCYVNLNEEDFNNVINGLTYDKFLGGLKKMSSDDSYQLVSRLPEDKAIEIVTSEDFKGSKLFTSYIGQKWDSIKCNMPYCVFDLESDGDSIREFAFYAEDNMRPYTGEDQINSLFRKLKKSPIIVGHNIKLWDLPILNKKGLQIPDSTFVWDTLEIEILLNPCRYAYSLHTEHNAEADTKLTNELFWNQLYRLSTDERLVEQLRDVLPDNIGTIINSLRVDYFSEYFRTTANLERQFFQELRPISDTLIKKLNQIAVIPESEATLLIAPSNLWSRLAQYIPLSFPGSKISNAYKSIDINILKDKQFKDVIKQCILERFCVVSRTPVLENLAQYLRVVDTESNKLSFTEDELQDYLCHYNSHIDCIDVTSFEDEDILSKDYKHIFIIGTELEDRVHKCKVCENKTFADLIACGSKLPFTMASTNFAPVKGDEIRKLGITKPELAANIWAEREQNGQFAFYLNYQYQAYRKRFLDHFKTKPQVLKWAFSGKDYGHINLTQVSRKRTADMVMRVNSSTTQRSKYWLFQIALLNKIHETNRELPIVYVVNDKKEIERLTKYAASQGFFIPTNGNGFRKLEYIGSHSNGMVIITKQEFIDGVGSYRTDKPFCYVWDNMDIDRYMLMWDKLPFDDDLEEDADDERDDKVHHTTPRQCIHAAWPIYEHYCSLVMANSEATQFYIIDPHFDDYEDIANSCQAQSFKVTLWETNSDYNEALENSGLYFDDSRGKEEDIDTITAIELIRKHFIGDYQWKPTQEEVLPFMWEKRGDCIVSMPTGEGKSVCFQGPALYRASITKKLSLVITPLRALMQDQVEDLHKKGFATNVDYLSGDRQRPEVENIYRKLRSGEIALLYITPERFRVKSFMNVLFQRMEMDGGLEYIIFDEAHCISQWGQEFRPDYRNAVLTCIELRKQFDFMFALFSATVTTQVESDIRSFLPDIQRLGQTAEDYNPIRQHIGISFALTEHEDEARIGEIVQFIEDKQIDFSLSCMIVFCRTHRQCEETADALSELALRSSPGSILNKCIDKIGFYHAGLDADLRNDVYEQFKRKEGVDPLYILCATKAFGMGMDIPNVHYIVHYSPPSVLEDYLQEVGRAGRDEKQYKLAFEDGKEKIPALCLTSKEDFRKLKELLVKSQMSWSNLTDAKDKIVEYIKRFQTIEQTKKEPIVVPFSVWVKNAEDFNDTTASRLAFHWLDHIGYIKQRYLSQACLDITVNDNGGRSSSLKRNPVYLYLEKNAQIKGQRSLVSMNEMRNSLRMSMSKIMNQIILCMEGGLLDLNETMNCKLVPRRFCEATFMVKHDRNDFALHIVFDGLRNLLSDCKQGKVRMIDQNEREHIYKHLMDDVIYDDIYDDNGVKYMPWKAEFDNPPRLAVTKYDTFRKNILKRMGSQMFTLLNYLPMVSYKVENLEDDIICQIKLKNDEWPNYLEQLERDCRTMIKYVVEKPEEFCWARVIIDLGWSKKGYRYFEDLLSILYHLAYVEHSPLVQSGIEILATESTESEIPEGLSEESNMFAYRKEFDDNEKIKKVRLSCMDIFTSVDEKEQGTFIQRYFQSKDYEDYLSLAGDYVPDGSDIMSELTEEALKAEEAKLENNEDQKCIYEQPTNKNVNVLAGPGAGKTHVLTLRCARLIYKEHVDPSHLLVLAYNRAVVVELRNRLNNLFTKLGMSRIAHQLNVYTFHALAKKCLGKKLDGISTEMWEYEFFNYLSKNVKDFKARFPNIEYVLVDEFQDITTVRLDSLLRIHHIFRNAKFFTIGDINQSIYGFDRVPKDNFGRKVMLQPEQYAEVLDPRPYYKKLDSEIHPEQLSMFTNYRSYQKILDKASEFIQEGDMPVSSQSIMKYEPTEPYVEEYDSIKDKGHVWFNDIIKVVNWAKSQNVDAEEIHDNDVLKKMRHIDTIAVFFRTNNEVYRGYSKIKTSLPKDVRIRIQGESLGEFWREREIYYLVDTLNRYANQKIDMRNNKTANGIKEFLKKKMHDSPSWDSYTLDIAYTLVLNYMDSIRSDYDSHTWKDLADYIIDIASRDDAGQVYKIYENYRKQRILQETPLTVVLTTMHKVKGLEFDVVITTPSFAGLPLRPHREYEKGENPNVDDLADMNEERRLMFVAYTRAKKRLIIYKAERERALSQSSIYLAPDYPALRYTEPKPGLDKYYLSYTAQSRIFENVNSYVLNQIKKDDPVHIVRDQYGNYFIVHNGHYIGRLSSRSTIRYRAEEDGKTLLNDFFVSNVFVWTYEDTLASDRANNTDFAARWSPEAKQQGYINIVQIAGFGTPNP